MAAKKKMTIATKARISHSMKERWAKRKAGCSTLSSSAAESFNAMFNRGVLVGVEFGYVRCERGDNLTKTLYDAGQMLSATPMKPFSLGLKVEQK